MPLNQQDIISFRPGDQIVCIQNGREMRIKIEAFVSAIASAVQNMATQDMVDALAAEQAADHIEDAEAMAVLQSEIDAMPAIPNITVPQTGIANPAAILTANVLGITVAIGGGTQALQGTVTSILAALRNAKIIAATPV